jgi:hypothetical protein
MTKPKQASGNAPKGIQLAVLDTFMEIIAGDSCGQSSISIFVDKHYFTL